MGDLYGLTYEGMVCFDSIFIVWVWKDSAYVLLWFCCILPRPCLQCGNRSSALRKLSCFHETHAKFMLTYILNWQYNGSVMTTPNDRPFNVVYALTVLYYEETETRFSQRMTHT